MSYQASLQKVIGAAFILLALVGCGSPAATSTSALAQELPTETPVPPTATDTPVPPTATETSVPPTATETSAPATATPTQFPAVGTDITVELPEGDAGRGEVLADESIVPARVCMGCHIGSRPPGPIFTTTEDAPAIRERAVLRIAAEDYTGAAMTPEQYLIESIVLPEAYRVEGRWIEGMPLEYGKLLTKQDVADIIAWMLTLE